MSNKPDLKIIRKIKPASSKPKRKGSLANLDLGMLLQCLDFEKLTVSEGGKSKRMPSIEVQYRTMFNKAINGDVNAASEIIKLAVKDYKVADGLQPQEPEFWVVADSYWKGGKDE